MFIKVVPLSEIRVGDVVVYEVNDRTGWPVEKIVVDGGKILLLFGGPFSRTDRPDRLVGLIHRPWPEGKTERDMEYAAHDAFMEFVVKTIGRPIVTACQHESFRAFLDAYEAYELGKSELIVKPEPLPEDPCRMGRCDHPKNFVGTCLVWAMQNPIQCDQRHQW